MTETMASFTALPLSKEPENYDEVAMHQGLLLSESLKDLKNLRKQLYTAAEFFELSYTSDDPKQIVVSTLKDYAVKALVNTVDHLGSVTYKVNDLLDEKADEVSGTETRVSSIEQRVRTCQTYIDREGLSQQSLVINTPKYHKHYVLPAGENAHGATESQSNHEGCILDDTDERHAFKNAVRATIIENPPSPVSVYDGKGRSQSPSLRPSQQPANLLSTGNMPKKDPVSMVLEKRTVSPHRFPVVHAGSLSRRPTTTNSRATSPASTPRSTTPNMSRSTTPNSRRGYPSEPRTSASMRLHGDRGSSKQDNEIPTKGKRLLKALLSRRKSKKDDTLYTYLDEY